MPSLVAEIGDAIEAHMKMIGMIKDEPMDVHRREFVESKRKEFQSRRVHDVSADEGGIAAEAQLCAKCQTKAVVMMDGCLTCLSCGDSKCG